MELNNMAKTVGDDSTTTNTPEVTAPIGRYLHPTDLRRYAEEAVADDEDRFAWHALQLLDQIEAPRYLMVTGEGEERWLPITRAGHLYDSGWTAVKIGGKVLEPDGAVRSITDAEKHKIADIADELSASK